MTQQAFTDLMAEVVALIAERPLDGALEDYLNTQVAPGGDLFRRIDEACVKAITDGWMCAREAGGIAYGRVIEPELGPHRFSVDVVRMKDKKGPHHIHPNGEIDLIMPLTPKAEFDGHGKGWCVYPPGSAHHPTVTGGEALVLYLLPDGVIEFTGQ